MNLTETFKGFLSGKKVNPVELSARKAFCDAFETYDTVFETIEPITSHVNSESTYPADLELYTETYLDDYAAAMELLSLAFDNLTATFLALNPSDNLHASATTIYNAYCDKTTSAISAYSKAARQATTNALEGQLQAAKDECEVMFLEDDAKNPKNADSSAAKDKAVALKAKVAEDSTKAKVLEQKARIAKTTAETFLAKVKSVEVKGTLEIPGTTSEQEADQEPFKFECQHCGQHISATPDQFDTAGTCPSCNASITVPNPASRQISKPEIDVSDWTSATDSENNTATVLPPVVDSANSTTEKLKAIGACALSFIISVGALLVLIQLLQGGVWLSDKLYPWLLDISALALSISVLALLPLAAFKETRGQSGLGFFIVSYVFGLTLWVWSLLLTYALWGVGALVVGLLFAGVGVLPMAMLATAFKGIWLTFGELWLVLLATFGTRIFGIYLAGKAEQQENENYEPAMPIKLIITSWLLFAVSWFDYLGYIAIIPLIVCSIILWCSKAKRARRHGQILLALLVVIFIVLFLIGWFNPDWFPERA